TTAGRPMLILRSESGPAPTNSGNNGTQKWRILTPAAGRCARTPPRARSSRGREVHLDDLRGLLDGAHAVPADADRHERRFPALEAAERPPVDAADLDAPGDAVQAVRVLRRDVRRDAHGGPQVLDLEARIADRAKHGGPDRLVPRNQLLRIDALQVQHTDRLANIDAAERKAHVVPGAKRRTRTPDLEREDLEAFGVAERMHLRGRRPPRLRDDAGGIGVVHDHAGLDGYRVHRVEHLPVDPLQVVEQLERVAPGGQRV